MAQKDKFSAGTGQSVKGSPNPEMPKKGAIDAAGKKNNSDVPSSKK